MIYFTYRCKKKVKPDDEIPSILTGKEKDTFQHRKLTRLIDDLHYITYRDLKVKDVKMANLLFQQRRRGVNIWPHM